MKISDVAGVFSRYFVVGFFIPAFFGLGVASLLLTSALIPDAFEHYAPAARLAILGGVAVPVGMLLQGFHPALLSGLAKHRSRADWYRFVPDRLYALALRPAQAGFDRLTRLSAPAAKTDGRQRRAKTADDLQQTRTDAGARLEERYPRHSSQLVPSQLGNVALATQSYVYSRWGLDTWSAWPRIESLLSEQERESITDSKTELAFFVDSALAAAGVGIALVVDEIWHAPVRPALGALYILPFLLAYGFYRLSIGAAVRWGQYQRAAVDLHRRELFEKMGFAVPETYGGQHRLARALNLFMQYRPPSEPGFPGERLVSLALEETTGALAPRTQRDADEIQGADWHPESAQLRWLEADCALHGVAYATTRGERVDPCDVVMDGGMAQRRHGQGGTKWASAPAGAGKAP